MVMKQAIAAVALAFLALFAVAGCTTATTITEIDPATGAVVKITKTERDPFDKITESTKDKTVVAWSNGWAAYIRATTATTENPTPTGEIYAGKIAKGVITLHKDQKNADRIPAIIAATREDVAIDLTGIKSTGSTDDTDSEKIEATTNK